MSALGHKRHYNPNLVCFGGHTGKSNLLKVSVVGAATTTEHREVFELSAQRAIAPADICWIRHAKAPFISVDPPWLALQRQPTL